MEDARIIKTKRRLFDALHILIEKRSINSVSVSELCRKAHINRTTFYKHYDVPVDIIHEQLDKIIEKLSISPQKEAVKLYDIMLNICKILLNNKWIITIYQSPNYDLILSLGRTVFPTMQHNIKDHSKHYFISGGILAMTMEWILQGAEESVEYIAMKLTNYAKSVLDQ